MITIEGLGGKGAVWCMFSVPVGMPLPSYGVLGYNVTGSIESGIEPIAPFACYLPPVGLASSWIDLSSSVYGPRVSKVDIGTLVGATKSPDTPNPCEQSTVKGALMCVEEDPLRQLRWLTPTTGLLVSGRYWYTPEGVPVLFVQGSATLTTSTPMMCYTRKGVLAKAYYNYGIKTLLAECANPPAFLSPTNVGSKSGVTYCSRRVSDDYSLPLWTTSSTSTHVSARVWKTVTIDEYHLDASYTPRSSESSDTGYSFLISSTKRERTYTMTHLQSVDPTVFEAKINCHEEVSWYGWDYPGGHFYGKTKADSSFRTWIRVMYPGLAVGGEVPVDEANAYCVSASPRAKLLYECKDATTARSNAVADVAALESNWLENLTQIGGTADVILPLLMGYEALKHGDISAARRALAGAYLSYMYVVAPGIRDYQDVKSNGGKLFKSFTRDRFSNERRRGQLFRETAVLETSAKLIHSCTLNLKLKDNPYAAVFNALERLGLDPSSGNLWDIIPFSFVVDWFFHIGPKLDRADALQNNVVLRDVTSRIESFKVQWPLSDVELGKFGWTKKFLPIGPLSYIWYDRRVLSGLGSFDSLAGQTNDGLSVSQMTQGTALLSSYKK